jgi:hypothetical protein
LEIGDWRSTRELNPVFRQIRGLGLESNLAELEAFGFTVIEPEVLGSADFANRLRAAALNLEAGQDPLLVKTFALEDRPAAGRQLFHFLDKDPIFCEALMHPAVIAMAKYLVGASCRISSTIIFSKHGPAAPTYIHCDSLAVPPPLPYFPAVCNVSWLLSDYNQENGTLFMVPGSHRYCRHPTANDQPAFLGGPESDDIGVPVTAKAGSLLVFGGNMWHGAYPKKDAGSRAHIAYFFCRNYVNPSEDFADVPDEVVKNYGATFANLLGRNAWQGYRKEGPDQERHRAVERNTITSYA